MRTQWGGVKLLSLGHCGCARGVIVINVDLIRGWDHRIGIRCLSDSGVSSVQTGKRDRNARRTVTLPWWTMDSERLLVREG